LDRNVDAVKIYDGTVWFDFPAGAGFDDSVIVSRLDSIDSVIEGLSSLTIDSATPTVSNEGDLWLDKNVDIVKIYDGSVWFDFPAGAGGGGLDSARTVSIIDSALTSGQISLDASPSGGASDDF